MVQFDTMLVENHLRKCLLPFLLIRESPNCMAGTKVDTYASNLGRKRGSARWRDAPVVASNQAQSVVSAQDLLVEVQHFERGAKLKWSKCQLNEVSVVGKLKPGPQHSTPEVYLFTLST